MGVSGPKARPERDASEPASDRVSRPSTTADLRARVARAQRLAASRSRDRGDEESGIRPLLRDESPPAVLSPAPQPTLDRASIEITPVAAEVSRTVGLSRPWLARAGRTAALLMIGAGLGMLATQYLLRSTAPATLATPSHTASLPPGTPSPAVGAGRPSLRARTAPRAPMTEIATDPPGAEVIVHNAVIANTPVKVDRPGYEALYLLRRTGYHPHLIRVSPQTGETVFVKLTPLAEPALVTDSANKPRPVARRGARGSDVGRQSTAERSHRSVAGGGAR